MIEAQLPDGTVLEFPEGTASDVMQRAVKQQLGIKAEPAPTPAEQPKPNTGLETGRMRKPVITGQIRNSPMDIAADQAAGNLLAGGVRGAGSIGATILAPYDMTVDALNGKGLSLESNRQRRADMDAGLQAMGAEPESALYKTGKLAGEVAGTAGAGGVLANGARAVGASAPIVQGLASGGLNVAGKTGALGLLTRGVTGAATGGVTAGMVSPEDAGLGAVIGGGLPIGAKLLAAGGKAVSGGIKSAVQPLYESGRRQIVGNALREFAGSQADDAIRNLRNAGELVDGSVPTVGQASGVPSLAALERASMASSPEATNSLAARLAEQNEARVSALRSIAGDDAAKEAALSARQEAADVAYRKARDSDLMRRTLAVQDQVAKDAKSAGLGSLGNAPVRSQAESAALAIRPTKTLEDLSKRPAFTSFINDAKRLAANKGQDIGDPLTSIDGLHYIKLAIDDALEPSATNAIGRNARSALMDMKTQLTAEMDKISPVYGVSRKAYEQASKPINQMAVGDALMSAVRPLDQQIMPTQFSKKLTDKTAQQATGFKGATLESTLDPAQLKLLSGIKNDLARAEFAKNAGRGVGSNTVQNLAYTNMLNEAGVPAFIRGSALGQAAGGLLGQAGRVVYSRANQDLAELMAQTMLSPQEAALLMTRKAPSLLQIQAANAGRKGLLGATKAAPVLIAQ